jgi:hypothetical protein
MGVDVEDRIHNFPGGSNVVEGNVGQALQGDGRRGFY